MEKSKICIDCKSNKINDEFYKRVRKNGNIYITPRCKVCSRLKTLNWSNENKEKKKETDKLWRQNNQEKKKESDKQWIENNKERKKENDKQWRQNNQEKIKEYKKLITKSIRPNMHLKREIGKRKEGMKILKLNFYKT